MNSIKNNEFISAFVIYEICIHWHILFYLSTVGLFSYNQLIFLDFEKLSNHKRQLYILQSYQVWFQIGFATINNFYQRISDFVVVMQQGYKMKYNPIITPMIKKWSFSTLYKIYRHFLQCQHFAIDNKSLKKKAYLISFTCV